MRDVGRALGIDAASIDAVAKRASGSTAARRRPSASRDRLRPRSRRSRSRWLELVAQLLGFPRHLSQHPGGFVIARDKLSRLVPVENAAMADRSVIQWDKDDLDALGLLKVDVLALGMLTAIRRALALHRRRGTAGAGACRTSRGDDPATYDMICSADTVGVFQIESRAQMSMLPRLKPRGSTTWWSRSRSCGPGPIQGGMVHPYLKRRAGAASRRPSPKPELDVALERTLGVPIFQEQVMQIACSPPASPPARPTSCAARWRRGSARAACDKFEQRLVGGMVENGYEREFAERIFKQIGLRRIRLSRKATPPASRCWPT